MAVKGSLYSVRLAEQYAEFRSRALRPRPTLGQTAAAFEALGTMDALAGTIAEV